jgi:hypothetical protein
MMRLEPLDVVPIHELTQQFVDEGMEKEGKQNSKSKIHPHNPIQTEF